MQEIGKAKELIRESVQSLSEEIVPLYAALGRVLSQNILAPISLPPFRQSAMDGYAIILNSGLNNRYKKGEIIQAGDALPKDIKQGEAVRIFTGAPTPNNANCVVMQEYVEATDSEITITKEVGVNDNIREIGEQISAGDMALEKGTVLTPSGLGFLQHLGITEVQVIAFPSVSLVVSGNELATPGTTLKGGEIYESNSITLGSAIEQAGYDSPRITFVQDNLEATIASFQYALNNSDMLLVSGGISVGDYDFAKKAFEHIGVKEIFYKVKQKPGKPLFFGMYGNKPVFGLPGNPASALVCLYQYVLPAMRLLSGKEVIDPMVIQLPLANTFSKRGDRPQFVKAITNGQEVTILDGQQSSMLHTFATANSLVFIPADLMQLANGDLVEVHLI